MAVAVKRNTKGVLQGDREMKKLLNQGRDRVRRCGGWWKASPQEVAFAHVWDKSFHAVLV